MMVSQRLLLSFFLILVYSEIPVHSFISSIPKQEVPTFLISSELKTFSQSSTIFSKQDCRRNFDKRYPTYFSLPTHLGRKSVRSYALPVTEQQLITSISVNAVWPVVATALKQKSLTTGGLINAALLGLILWGCFGWQGWSVAVVYLIFGSGVTKVKMEEKEKLGIAEARGGRRGPENVWGSALTGAICAIAAVFFPQYKDMLQLGFIASFATKLSDTFGSEIGKAYGKSTYLITSLKPVPRGTEGAVSLEGTMAGVAGSIILAAWGVFVGQIGLPEVFPTLAAAFIACNVESYLGATTQGKTEFLTNETINFINTLIGAMVAVAIRNVL